MELEVSEFVYVNGAGQKELDGAMSILTGIAANKSIATGMPVDIKPLVEF